jgi:hypothetical protein
MACGCKKTREERMAEMQARRDAMEAAKQAVKTGQVGPQAPGYFADNKQKV